MRYACLVYADGPRLDALTDIERTQLRTDFLACEHELHRSGHLVTAAPLAPVQTATTVRVREGRQLTTDGAAVDGPGQSGAALVLEAVIVLEARDLNEAIRLAAKLPGARMGRVEIRPVATPDKALHMSSEQFHN